MDCVVNKNVAVSYYGINTNIMTLVLYIVTRAEKVKSSKVCS